MDFPCGRRFQPGFALPAPGGLIATRCGHADGRNYGAALSAGRDGRPNLSAGNRQVLARRDVPVCGRFISTGHDELPFVDEHAITIAASREWVWSTLQQYATTSLRIPGGPPGDAAAPAPTQAPDSKSWKAPARSVHGP